LLVLAFVAYIVIVVIVSGSLRFPLAENGFEKHIDKQNAAAWCLALLSTFGLPWSGIPLSSYLGAGSWTWFLFAVISLSILKCDGRGQCIFRRCFTVANVVVIVSAVYAFMYKNGVPGDIPGIEGMGAISSLDGLTGKKLMLVQTCFLVSAIASFLPVYSPSERAPSMLSFSYASFLAIAFLPPARMFFSVSPDIAIIIDVAAYFMFSWYIHVFIMGSLSKHAASFWCYSYAALNAALTAAGIYFLFS